jgi:hypothetical protein
LSIIEFSVTSIKNIAYNPCVFGGIDSGSREGNSVGFEK